MKEFLKKLISVNGEVSSKRFISLYSLILLTAIVICNLCGLEIADFIFYGVISLILGTSTLTIFNK